MRKTALLATTVAVALLASGGPPADAADPLAYSAVTQARLEKPEPGNWLMARGNYAGWGFSPLDQITSGNVKELVPAVVGQFE